MTDHHLKKILANAVQDLAAGKEPRNIDAVIAGCLERELSYANGNEMEDIHSALADYVHDVFRVLPKDKMIALRDMTDPILMVAYHAGAAGMAQITAAKAMTGRAGKESLAALHDPDNLDLLIAIMGEERSRAELAEICGEDEAIMARRLDQFLTLGIAYWRQGFGKNVWNLNPHFEGVVKELAKARNQSRAVEAALAVLEGLDGEAATQATAALQAAFGAAEPDISSPTPI